MALPANTPCAGVSTLEAQAWCHTGSGTVIAAMDARRGQVYWAAFDLTTHARLTPDAAAPREEAVAFARSCKKPVIYIGDGAALCYNKDEQALPCPPALRVARAVGAGLAGRALWAAGGCVPPAGLDAQLSSSEPGGAGTCRAGGCSKRIRDCEKLKE